MFPFNPLYILYESGDKYLDTAAAGDKYLDTAAAACCSVTWSWEDYYASESS
jgi:hypothetical protein